MPSLQQIRRSSGLKPGIVTERICSDAVREGHPSMPAEPVRIRPCSLISTLSIKLLRLFAGKERNTRNEKFKLVDKNMER